MTQTLAESSAPPTATRKKVSRLKRGWSIALSTIILLIIANILAQLSEPWLFESRMYGESKNIPYVLRTLAYNPSPNLVFIGTSRVAQGFDPVLTEQTLAQTTGKKLVALNLGIAGADTEVSYLLLKNVLKDNKKPDVIVYGLSEIELINEGFAFNDLSYGKDTLLRLDDFGDYAGENLLSQTSFVLKQFFPLYRNKNLLKDSFSTRYNPDDPNNKIYNGTTPFPVNGFRTWPVGAFSQNPQGMLDYYSFLGKNPPFNEKKLSFLDKFIKVAQERNIKVVLVNMPVMTAHVNLWKNPQKVANYQTRIKQVADKYNVPLLDFYTTGEEVITKQGFFDSNHMNYTGAEILTKLVLQKYLQDFFK